MYRYIAPMFWRYSGLLIQFVIVLLVAQTVELHVAGQYFSFFGFVTVSYILSGLGIPDALVRVIPLLHAQSRSSGDTLLSGFVLSTAINLAVLVCGSLSISLCVGDSILGWLLGLWWFAYAQVFLASQILIAVASEPWGLFGAYSAINFGYVVTLVPYLIIMPTHTVKGMILSAVIGATLALVIVMAALIRRVGVLNRKFTDIGEFHPSCGTQLVRLVSMGLPMTSSRLLQGMVPWLPVWFLTFSVDAEMGAVYAASSRLAVVVTAILGSIRFGSRPEIVSLEEEHSWRQLEKLSRRASYMSAVGASIAFVALLVAGKWIVRVLLGAGYDAATPVLMILMAGILAEAFGGLSDEILKMMGKAWVVLATLFASTLIQTVLLALFARHGVEIAAWTSVIAFAIQYGLQVAWLRLYTPVRIWSSLFSQNRAEEIS